MKEEKFENYGDVSLTEGARFVKKVGDTEYQIVSTDFIEDCEDDKCYIVTDCLVDISDSWIDKEDVMSYAGMVAIDVRDDPIRYALSCLSYYGWCNFGEYLTTYEGRLLTEDEMIKEIECVVS